MRGSELRRLSFYHSQIARDPAPLRISDLRHLCQNSFFRNPEAAAEVQGSTVAQNASAITTLLRDRPRCPTA
jgi:hypothetical protein